MSTAYLNIGSNIGDRMALIERAVAAVVARVPRCVCRVSTPVESEPWGYDSANRYINVGVALEHVDLTPLELLRECRAVERTISPASHRDAAGGYADRMIDIDLIAFDDVVMDCPELTLPHPRMHLRDFVLLPQAELAPMWMHPMFRLTAAELLERL